MEPKYIRFKANQVELAKVHADSLPQEFGVDDVKAGSLVIGTDSTGSYLCLGFLREISRAESTGEIAYKIVDAVEDQIAMTVIFNPRRVSMKGLPRFAARTSASSFVVGTVASCNGYEVVVWHEKGSAEVSVNDIYELMPYFKETK